MNEIEVRISQLKNYESLQYENDDHKHIITKVPTGHIHTIVGGGSVFVHSVSDMFSNIEPMLDQVFEKIQQMGERYDSGKTSYEDLTAFPAVVKAPAAPKKVAARKK